MSVPHAIYDGLRIASRAVSLKLSEKIYQKEQGYIQAKNSMNNKQFIWIIPSRIVVNSVCFGLALICTAVQLVAAAVFEIIDLVLWAANACEDEPSTFEHVWQKGAGECLSLAGQYLKSVVPLLFARVFTAAPLGTFGTTHPIWNN